MFVHHSWCNFYVFPGALVDYQRSSRFAKVVLSMIIRELRASNPSFTHIIINDKNVGTRNHVIAVIYENLGTPEEILHVKETYAGDGYIVAVKQDKGNI